MSRFLKSIILLVTLVPPFGFAAGAAHAEKRIALVIGNAGYQAGALNTPSNDAGLIAQTLQASGFDVVARIARDSDVPAEASEVDKGDGVRPAHAILIKTRYDAPSSATLYLYR